MTEEMLPGSSRPTSVYFDRGDGRCFSLWPICYGFELLLSFESLGHNELKHILNQLPAGC